ncbi:MAG: phage baseplate assembly protein V [Candidatus Limnocylindrales bacterium]
MSLTPAQPPQVRLEVGGTTLPGPTAAALVALHVRQVLAEPSLCELVFAQPPGPLDAADTLTPGATLGVTIAGQATPLFEGDITAAEHVYEPDRGRTLRIRGYDRLHRLRQRQQVRVFEDTSAGHLAQVLGADAGLSVDAAIEGPTIARLVQDRRTDLGLLTMVTESAGLYPVVRGDTLHLVSLEGLAEEAPRLFLGRTLYEASFEANAGPALDTVTATGWDATTGVPVTAAASPARSGRTSPAVAPASALGTDPRDLVDVAAPTTDRAQARAQAELDRSAAASVVFRGVAMGDPRLRPGTPVEVEGVDARFAGRYVVVEAEHTIDAERGYLCRLSSAPPEPRTEPAGPVHAVLGVVRDIDDPDGLGRVRVTIPTLRDVESSWMQVLTVGAGADKGLVALPEVDDRVLVLLLHGDPAQGVVLGGLYGPGGPYDTGIEGGRVRRTSLRTPGGHLVRLDDEAGTLRLDDASGGSVELADHAIRLEDANGNHVELTRDRVRVHAATDLVLEAPGGSVTVRGSSVDFETA